MLPKTSALTPNFQCFVITAYAAIGSMQPGPPYVPPPEQTVPHNAQFNKSNKKVTTDTIKMFVPHMVAAHTSLVPVPKQQVYLLL